MKARLRLIHSKCVPLVWVAVALLGGCSGGAGSSTSRGGGAAQAADPIFSEATLSIRTLSQSLSI